MDDLAKIRAQLDDIDEEIVELFEKRMDIALDVISHKQKNNKPILYKSRETEIINRFKSMLNNKKYETAVEELFNCIMSISREIQIEQVSNQDDDVEKELWDKRIVKKGNEVYSKLKVGYQGVPGSFTYMALLDFFEKKELDVIDYSNNFESVFKAMENGEIDYGVIPIENSSTGAIGEVYDLLRKYDFSIIGERAIEVEHNLLGIRGSNIEEIKEVYSHPQALLQCSEFLNEYTDIKTISYNNTAMSAKYVRDEKLSYKAAIGSRIAGELYDLDILKKNVNNNTINFTRFIIIGKKIELDITCNKVSIIISTPHKPGELFNVLKIFSENNLNMLKLESRPITGKVGEYFFYIDFEGNLEEDFVGDAIKLIEEKCKYFKILGNYHSKGLRK